MPPSLTRALFATATLLTLLASSTVLAGTIALTLNLDVQQRLVGAIYGGTSDPGFVPFQSSATLVSNSSLVDSYTIPYLEYGYIATVANFAAGNQFTSGLTALLPWGPPFSVPTTIDYNRALYVHNTFTDPGADPAENNHLLFDRRERYNDTAAQLEYYHAFALQNDDSTTYPIAPDWAAFGEEDLVAYLTMLRDDGTPLRFVETAFVYDYAAHTLVSSVLFESRATIASVSAVPVPAAAWLLGGALGALACLRRNRHG